MASPEIHSECSPSQLDSIILCPGRRRLKREWREYVDAQREMLKADPTNTAIDVAAIISENGSQYAKEGTMLHSVMEYKIKVAYPEMFGISSTSALAQLIKDNTALVKSLTKEQNTVTDEAFEYFQSVLRELNLTTEILSIELEAPTSLAWAGLPEGDGHVDVLIVSTARVDIIDWKFGQGVAVVATNNTQGKSYAAGSMAGESLRQVKDVYIHIVQPRLHYMSYWRTTGEELYSWVAGPVTDAILESRKPDAPCFPGTKQCKWCVPKCETRVANAHNVAAEVFQQYASSESTSMVSDIKLSQLLKDTAFIEAFRKEILAEAFKRALSGQGFPGYKVVQGRASRVWVDEKAAETWLLAQADSDDAPFEFDDIYNTKMVSVAQAEALSKSVKKNKEFIQLYRKAPGQPSLVEDSDPRESMVGSAQEAFAQFAVTP